MFKVLVTGLRLVTHCIEALARADSLPGSAGGACQAVRYETEPRNEEVARTDRADDLSWSA
jgi:alcohol dehydrogenase class IV